MRPILSRVNIFLGQVAAPKVIYKYVAPVKDKVGSFSFVAQKAHFELKMLSKKLKRHKGKVAEGRLVRFPNLSVNPTLPHNT